MNNIDKVMNTAKNILPLDTLNYVVFEWNRSLGSDDSYDQLEIIPEDGVFSVIIQRIEDGDITSMSNEYDNISLEEVLGLISEYATQITYIQVEFSDRDSLFIDLY